MPTNRDTCPSVTLAQIKALRPCDRSWDRVSTALKAHGVKARQKITARDAADAGCKLDDLIWIASAVSRKDKDVERRLTLFLADCAAKVLHHFEREFPTDMRVRNCIIAQRQYARGEIDEAARAAEAAEAAWAASEQWQLERLILWLTDEPSDWPLPAIQQAQAA